MADLLREKLGFREDVVQLFESNDIDGEAFLLLEDKDLEKLGVTLPGERRFEHKKYIWINAKQLTARRNKMKTKEDHRVRIDIGKLTSVVANHRPVAQG